METPALESPAPAAPERFDAANVEVVPLASLAADPRNAMGHDENNIAAIMASLTKFGQQKAIVVVDGVVKAGNGTMEAARRLGWQRIAITHSTLSGDDADAYAIADNQTAKLAVWKDDVLGSTLKQLNENGFDLGALHFDAAELERLVGGLEASGPTAPGGGEPGGEGGAPGASLGSLAERFLVPPFSVLDARQGYWQDRKRQWLALGIESEVGRGGNLLKMSPQTLAARALGISYDDAKEVVAEARKDANDKAAFRDQDKLAALRQYGEPYEGGDAWAKTGTSIFDPVVCELAYRWFCPRAGYVLDPFAGGSVRGIVAAKLGLRYTGYDLRQEQVDANKEQAKKILDSNNGGFAIWHCGDSSKALAEINDETKDLIFSCPPYADLEVYSDDPADISNMPWEHFLAAYRTIIAQACDKLQDHRFAVWVVGEVREKGGVGAYHNLVGETVCAFEAAGLRFYNESILVTSVGTLPLRAGKIFSASRKVGKTHQQVLVFVKGDPKKASAACGEVDMSDVEAMFAPEAEGEVVIDKPGEPMVVPSSALGGEV